MISISETNFVVVVPPAAAEGTTNVDLVIAGMVALLCIKAPSASVKYDIEIRDMQDF